MKRVLFVAIAGVLFYAWFELRKFEWERLKMAKWN